MRSSRLVTASRPRRGASETPGSTRASHALAEVSPVLAAPQKSNPRNASRWFRSGNLGRPPSARRELPSAFSRPDGPRVRPWSARVGGLTPVGGSMSFQVRDSPGGFAEAGPRTAKPTTGGSAGGVYPVAASMQQPTGNGRRGPARLTDGCPASQGHTWRVTSRRDRGPTPLHGFAAQTALARSAAPGRLRLDRLLFPRRRQAGVVRWVRRRVGCPAAPGRGQHVCTWRRIAARIRRRMSAMTAREDDTILYSS